MSTLNNEADLSGMLGKVVSVRKVGKRVVVANRPKMKMGKPSSKQERVQHRFLAAVAYAKKQVAQPESKAMYTAGITEKKNSAYQVAFRDYLKPPKVDAIDTLSYRGAIGDAIVVTAFDDFMVTKVVIVITDASGVIIEQGEAGRDLLEVNLWAYKATAANPTLAGTTIKAVAYDRPGHTGTAEVKL